MKLVKIILTKDEYNTILQNMDTADESNSIHIANIIRSAIEDGNVEVDR